MAREFRLPDIGEGLTEAEIVRWRVAVGDSVEVDETVVEVETDKAVVEIPSPFAGVVLFHGASEGSVLAVGEILVVVGEAGEVWPPEAVSEPAGSDAAPIVGSLSSEAVDLTPGIRSQAPVRRRVLALPAVRKLAQDLGVDIESVVGTGAEGRVTRDDVMAAASGSSSGPASAGAAPVEEADVPSDGRTMGSEDERRPLSRTRRTIAANMVRSWQEIPHVTTFDHVDATRLLEARAAIAQRHQVSVPVDAMVVAAIVPALGAFPEFNATLDGDDLILHSRCDIGVAVDTPDGLVVAVIEDAAGRTLLSLADEIRRLGEGARSRTLTVAELTGQTFTVSNIGAVGGGLGTPIVPYGTVGILSVGRASATPVAHSGRVEIAPMMPLSLSYDHRVIDGGVGRRFMAMVMENLREPALFLA